MAMPSSAAAAARTAWISTSGIVVSTLIRRAPRSAGSRCRWAAHGIASSRSAAIGRPQRVQAPYVPSSSRRERVLDLGKVLRVAVAQREVALLFEDLAGRGGL